MITCVFLSRLTPKKIVWEVVESSGYISTSFLLSKLLTWIKIGLDLKKLIFFIFIFD